ncbi:hypothetical protein BaRGS_00028255 [Batillaria attramentaria]|uniref:Uncharacterized protein n=1 Tax=Batillaria attramentaria TaxID=370345 RepID=A0ABD0K0K4_9CAEN
MTGSVTGLTSSSHTHTAQISRASAQQNQPHDMAKTAARHSDEPDAKRQKTACSPARSSEQTSGLSAPQRVTRTVHQPNYSTAGVEQTSVETSHVVGTHSLQTSSANNQILADSSSSHASLAKRRWLTVLAKHPQCIHTVAEEHKEERENKRILLVLLPTRTDTCT